MIRDVEINPLPWEKSEFAVIHFDGPDSYWLHSEFGDIKEFFKRVR